MTTASPMTGFSHVQLLVTDLPASEAWYTTALGLRRFSADETKGYVALWHDASRIMIVLTPRAATGTDATDTAGATHTVLDHLAFAVPNGEVLDEWAAHLTDAGIGTLASCWSWASRRSSSATPTATPSSWSHLPIPLGQAPDARLVDCLTPRQYRREEIACRDVDAM